MRGQPDRLDSGNLFDALLRAIASLGSRAGQLAERRCDARRLAASHPRGTRVLITGQCCASEHRNKQGTIHSYVMEADDYRILIDNDPSPRRVDGFDCTTYACVHGFTLTGGRQPEAFWDEHQGGALKRQGRAW